MGQKKKSVVSKVLAEAFVDEGAQVDALIKQLKPSERQWLYTELRRLKATAKQPRTKRFHIVSLRESRAKDGRSWIELITEQNEEAVTCDGFESCVIGVANRFGMEPVVAYDYDKCIDLLVSRDHMDYEEAIEYFEFNTIGAWVGKGTPVFVSTRLS